MLTPFGVPLLFTMHEFSRFWYPPITSISSAVGYLFLRTSTVSGLEAAVWGADGLPGEVGEAEAPAAGLLGVMVMVVPLFPGPPEALRMEKRGGA